MDLKFYNELELKFQNYTLEIEHPNKGDEMESVEMKIEEHSVEKI